MDPRKISFLILLTGKYCNSGKSSVQSSELDAKSDINEIKLMVADHAEGNGILSALYISLLPNSSNNCFIENISFGPSQQTEHTPLAWFRSISVQTHNTISTVNTPHQTVNTLN